MDCPVCHVTLVLADRQGIEIDYCPKCRGVWLDRGELDKIIERSGAEPEGRAGYREPEPPAHPGDYRKKFDSDDDYYRKKHKKRGFLGDLFDFD